MAAMKATSAHQPNFDPIARSYRWLEYLTLGTALERARNHHLPALRECRRALILGDGDGRFTAQLLLVHQELYAHAIDSSASMLALLQERVGVSDRLSFGREDARRLGSFSGNDLVVTHFFLDCLTEDEVRELILRLVPSLVPDALWLVTEFRIPEGFLHWPARLYIRLLYLAFRILTGLRVTRLPDFAACFRAAGFVRIAEHKSLLGLLTTEIWQLP